jgi:metal-dependent amidase/aminoacylase/carboxypeptidase family protein
MRPPRVRVEFQGPGGHSYGSYGRVSALHAAARAVILIQEALPAGSYQITNLTGGNSVNAIASDGLIELKLAAGSAAAHQALVTRSRRPRLKAPQLKMPFAA